MDGRGLRRAVWSGLSNFSVIWTFWVLGLGGLIVAILKLLTSLEWPWYVLAVSISTIGLALVASRRHPVGVHTLPKHDPVPEHSGLAEQIKPTDLAPDVAISEARAKRAEVRVAKAEREVADLKRQLKAEREMSTEDRLVRNFVAMKTAAEVRQRSRENIGALRDLSKSGELLAARAPTEVFARSTEWDADYAKWQADVHACLEGDTELLKQFDTLEPMSPLAGKLNRTAEGAIRYKLKMLDSIITHLS